MAVLNFILRSLLFVSVTVWSSLSVVNSIRTSSDRAETSKSLHWGYGNSSDPSGIGYLGPDYWTNLPEGTACNGSRQSPINLETAKAVRVSFKSDPLYFDNYATSPIDERWTFINNGHSVQLNTSYEFSQHPELRQAHLTRSYVFDQIHFHWGSDDEFGSEHTIDNKPAALELHLVHRLKNVSIEDINQRPDGLAVLGIMFEIGKSDNQKLESFVRNLRRVAEPGCRVDDAVLAGHTIMELIPTNKSFFRYMGSLTTPPCTENVLWTVFTKKQKISLAQLAVFRTVLANNEQNGTVVYPLCGKQSRSRANKNEISVSDNYRPVQSLNGRIVSLYVDGGLSLSLNTKLVLSLTFLSIRRFCTVYEYALYRFY